MHQNETTKRAKHASFNTSSQLHVEYKLVNRTKKNRQKNFNNRVKYDQPTLNRDTRKIENILERN